MSETLRVFASKNKLSIQIAIALAAIDPTSIDLSNDIVFVKITIEKKNELPGPN